jgi:hypothetical protein
MEMDCNAHQSSPVSKIQIYVGLMPVAFPQLQASMNASVMKVLQEMELSVKVSRCTVWYTNGISTDLLIHLLPHRTDVVQESN